MFSGKAFTPTHLCDKPKIFTCHAMWGRKAKVKGKATAESKEAPPLEEGEEKGDLLIRDLWTQGTDIIHNMHVMNTDAVS